MDEELSFECKLKTNTQLWSCEMCNVAAECIIEQRNFFQSWGRGGSLNSFIFTFRFSSPYACMWHVIRITTKCIFRFIFPPSHPSGNIHLVAIGDFLILTLLLHMYSLQKLWNTWAFISIVATALTVSFWMFLYHYSGEKKMHSFEHVSDLSLYFSPLLFIFTRHIKMRIIAFKTRYKTCGLKSPGPEKRHLSL